jgi:hypothetical protein
LKHKNDKTEPSPQVSAWDWQTALVTLLVGAVAFCLVAAQFSYAQDPQNQSALANLDKRVPILEQTPDWIQRDKLYDVGLSGLGRQLDAAIAPDAKVFMTGMLGPTNSPSAGYYYFLRNYLFPRHLQISLDGKATNTEDGFIGVPCNSPEILKSNGYDVMIQFSDGQLQNVIALTPKAVRHQND